MLIHSVNKKNILGIHPEQVARIPMFPHADDYLDAIQRVIDLNDAL